MSDFTFRSVMLEPGETVTVSCRCGCGQQRTVAVPVGASTTTRFWCPDSVAKGLDVLAREERLRQRADKL